MKNINFCAITFAALTALAIQFSGLQNCAFAQSGHSCPGGCHHDNAGEDIELIYNGKPAGFENSPRSLLQTQTAFVNETDNRGLSREFYSESQRAAFYEGMRYQQSLSRDFAGQSNRSLQNSYSRTQSRNRYNQAAYADNVQPLESPVQRNNRSDLDQQYQTYRREFTAQESASAQAEGRPHRSGCRGRCRSHERDGDYDGVQKNRNYPQRDEFPYDQRRPNQFPNSEADQAPSLRVPIPPAYRNQSTGYRNDSWQPNVDHNGDRTAFFSPN